MDEDDRRLPTGVSPLDLFRLAGCDRPSLRGDRRHVSSSVAVAGCTLSRAGTPSKREARWSDVPGEYREDGCVPERHPPTRQPRGAPEKVSEQIERWLASGADTT